VKEELQRAPVLENFQGAAPEVLREYGAPATVSP
jgi:hypothetical protein